MRRRFSRTGRSLIGLILLAAVVGVGTLVEAGSPPPGQAGTTMTRAEVAVIGTPYGDIVWRFFDQDAPGHAAYVKALIRQGLYDGTTFHRVIPHFVVQGGDPNSKDEDRANDGEGEADRRLKAEFSTRLHYRPGTVGMARDVDPDSGSCQFFIALTDLPRLDTRYTIFAEVIEGMEVAQRIADRPRDRNDNPIERVSITARLERRRVPAAIGSLEPSTGSGEILTGPAKPGTFDPGNALWAAPRLRTDPAARSTGATIPPDPGGRSPQRIEVALGADGTVLDVRFLDLIDPDRAADLRRDVLTWRFEPALLDGTPRKVRFEIDSDGSRIGPPTGGGAPITIAQDLTPPQPALRLLLRPDQKPPSGTTRLRLWVDETGKVADVWLQRSCGDPGLDQAAVAAAREMAFDPARRPHPGTGDPEPVAVYLNLEARYTAAD